MHPMRPFVHARTVCMVSKYHLLPGPHHSLICTPLPSSHAITHSLVACLPPSLMQGDEYFGKERSRLERMISSGGVAANKVDDFARKSSVLSAFLAEDAATAEE